ncbi:hypothetical protein EG329_008968 [Mollisiaceae sp. DMI_Dod_QoI]|nr:hypothetical protein EG329_008968 [Helotiales sp. DMI_Dod_QoI]
MDPISMAMTASAVIHTIYQTTKSIYTFVSGATSADKSMESMIRELNSLRDSTHSIETCLRNPLLQRQLEAAEKIHRDELFLSIHGSLKSAQDTLEKFQQTLDTIRGEQSSLSTIRQPLILLGLNFNAHDIMIYRAQITAHVHALMMGMQLITVYTSIQSPNIVINEVVPKLNVLMEMVADLSSEHFDQLNVTIPEVERVRIEETTSQLKVASQHVIISARSVTSRGSNSGSSFSGGQRLLSVRDGFSDWNSDGDREEIRESATAAEFDTGLDPEEETMIEFFESVLKEGHRRLQEGHTEDAISCYRKALEAAEKTRLRIQPNANYNDACLKLAQIHQQQKKPKEAKSVLSNMLSKSISIPSNLAEQIVDAWYLMAQIHIELKDLKQAEEYCTKAMNARRRLDKGSDGYRDSVMLLAAIYDEKNDPVTAIGWRGLVHPPTPASAHLEYVEARYYRPSGSVSTATTSTVESKIFDEESLSQSDPFRPSLTRLSQDPKDLHASRDNPLFSRYEKGTRHGVFGWTVPSSFNRKLATLPEILESNAPHVIYHALKALDADILTRPTSSIRNQKFDPHIALRKCIHKGQVEVAWLLLYKLNHVKAQWQKHNHRFWKSKPSNFPEQIDANYVSEHGITFLEDACLSKITGRAKHDMVDLLLHYGVEVNPPRLHFVPLVRATLDGDHDLVEILLQHKADPDARLRNMDGSTEHAAEDGNVMVNDTILISATDLNLPRVVDALLVHNAKVDLTSVRGTALCVAAEKGHLDIVRTLLEYNADANAIRPFQNTTPLCLAAKNGHTSVVRVLLSHGANIRHEVKPKFTAIVYAIQQRHHAIAEILRDKGAKE